MSYLEKLFVKRDNIERWINTHGSPDNQIVLSWEVTDRLIQRWVL